MTEKLTRRAFIKVSAATIATAGIGSGLGALPLTADAKPRAAAILTARKAYLPKARGPRVVVVGAGTAGLTIAKYLKKENSAFDVVVVEKRASYTSCFSSNLWYPGLVNLEFLSHSFLDAARNGNYLFFSATCIGVDRVGRKVFTDHGEIDYDYLALTPGIDYDYEKIGVSNPEDEYRLRTEYPAGWTMGTEHVTLKRKIDTFAGGVFVQTVPTGNYRCLPAPYERACMIAAVFKRNKIKGKVLVLDRNPDITIKKDGFHAAFDELYKDIIEYVPSVEITGVDVENKTIKTEFDSYTFDDAAIYPNIRASKLIEYLGLVDPKSLQKEANIDVLKYHIIGDEHVYVAGDSRPMPFSKSANTSNTEGKYVARLISAHAEGKEIPWTSPETICYSMVNAEPKEAISVDARYEFNAEKQEFGFSKDTKMFEERDAEKGNVTLKWAQGIYTDLFGVA